MSPVPFDTLQRTGGWPPDVRSRFAGRVLLAIIQNSARHKVGQPSPPGFVRGLHTSMDDSGTGAENDPRSMGCCERPQRYLTELSGSRAVQHVSTMGKHACRLGPECTQEGPAWCRHVSDTFETHSSEGTGLQGVSHFSRLRCIRRCNSSDSIDIWLFIVIT